MTKWPLALRLLGIGVVLFAVDRVVSTGVLGTLGGLFIAGAIVDGLIRVLRWASTDRLPDVPGDWDDLGQLAPDGPSRRSTSLGGRALAARSRTRFGVAELARRLGMSEAELASATPAYARFTMPKRNARAGSRPIAAPDAATKALQRRVLRRVLGRLRTHPAVHGFERDRSIATNAAVHAGRPVVVSIDLADFFAATQARRVRRFFRVIGWDREAAHVLTRLTTVDGGLPQGAPSSPRLANLVNVGLDAKLTTLASRHGATYTRYADDLTFSWPTDDAMAVRRLVGGVRRIVRRSGYAVNGRKVRLMRSHRRQLVTGLVVNERPALTRERRRWLRAVEHRLRTAGAATISADQLRGWQAFEVMVTLQATPGPGSPAT